MKKLIVSVLLASFAVVGSAGTSSKELLPLGSTSSAEFKSSVSEKLSAKSIAPVMPDLPPIPKIPKIEFKPAVVDDYYISVSFPDRSDFATSSLLSDYLGYSPTFKHEIYVEDRLDFGYMIYRNHSELTVHVQKYNPQTKEEIRSSYTLSYPKAPKCYTVLNTNVIYIALTAKTSRCADVKLPLPN